MISKKCKGLNLLNHLQQTKKIQNLKINYEYNKENYGLEWNCSVSFSNKNDSYIFSKNSKKKRVALQEILKNNETKLHLVAGLG